MGGRPSDFDYRVLGGDVLITHRGLPGTTWRGDRARRFLADVENQDAQEMMARLTGNYQHGDERLARRHPANQGSDRPPASA